MSALTPRLPPLGARKSVTVSVLDVGASKTVCLIAKLVPMERGSTLRARTHRVRVLGLGQQRTHGVKAGAVVDLEAAETAIRLAIDAAERMAGVEVEAVVLNMSGGRLNARAARGRVALKEAVRDVDIARALEAAAQAALAPGRAALHLLPHGFALDGQRDVADPRGMIGQNLEAELVAVSCDLAPARNLMLAVERCHLRVAGVVASPYASGLSTLVDDEAELGAALIDFGAGATTLAAFAHDRLTFVDALPVGGQHVTMDLARGLSVSLADAERIKTTYASCAFSLTEERETLAIRRVGDERPISVAKAELSRIVRPRVEEILELARERLAGAGMAAHVARRLVLTGGAASTPGLADLARQIVSPQARLGRPLGIEGLPDAAKTPAFATVAGLMMFPQVAGLEHAAGSASVGDGGAEDDGYVSRVRRWLKQSF